MPPAGRAPVPRWRARLGLAPNIKLKHLIGFVIHSTASITFLVLLNSLQPSLISYLSKPPAAHAPGRGAHSDPGGAHDPTLLKTLGRLNGTLLFCDEALSIVLVLFWGSLAELIGTRSVAVLGYLLVAIGLNAFAMSHNAWPHLLISRLIFATGASAVTSMLSGLLASFVKRDDTQAGSAAPPAQAPSEETPLLGSTAAAQQESSSTSSGRLASVAGVFTGVGALIAVFGLLRLPPVLAGWMDESIVARKPAAGPRPSSPDDATLLLGIRYTLGLSAASSLVIALLLRFTLPAKPPSVMEQGQAVFAESAEPEDPEPTPSAAAEAAFAESGGRTRRRLTQSLSLQGGDRQARRQRLRARIARRQETSFRAQLLKLARGLFEGIVVARRSRTLVIAYIGGAMARATTVGTTAFLPLLVAHFFYTSGICTDIPDPTLPADEIKQRCRQAFTWTSIVSGVAQLTALLLAPFIGIIADALSPQLTMCIAALSGLTGYLLFGFGLPGGIDGDPRSPRALVAAALIGVCQIGTIICSLALLGKARRLQGFAAGPLAGAYSFFGGLAILATSAVGAGLFDLWTPSPFIMLAVLAAVAAGASGVGALVDRGRNR